MKPVKTNEIPGLAAEMRKNAAVLRAMHAAMRPDLTSEEDAALAHAVRSLDAGAKLALSHYKKRRREEL